MNGAGHEPKPEKAPITEQQRALDRHAERNLDVPESLLLEARSLGEQFDAKTAPVERLTLQANALRRSAHARVTERLHD